MAEIALQLWTIREECDRDLATALRRVGDLGYAGVELFQLHGHTAEQVRTLLDEHGLVAVGRHARLEVFEREAEQLAAELAVLGTRRAAISWIDPEDVQRPESVSRVAAAAEAGRAAGLEVGFHNHWSEVAPLAGEETFLDRLRTLPAELLWLELDLGWVWHGGGDPTAELAATRGRCPLVHVKDYASREGRDDVPVGEGLVGYERVVPEAVAAGAEWLVVEEDEVGPDPFGAIERSLRALQGYLR